MINKSTTIFHIRNIFKNLLNSENYEIDKSGVKMLEIIGANFIADAPAIFGTPNEEYIKKEIAWYNSQSLNVFDIAFGNPPKIWRDVAAYDGSINSNYGWCIWSTENYEQYERVKFELTKQPNSRRAIMIYTRPSMWEDYNRNGMSDFMCTNTVQYVIRDNKLVTIVQMRSNDVIFGYKNDWAWAKYVRDSLLAELMDGPYPELSAGDIIWSVGSFHIYERHFSLVKD